MQAVACDSFPPCAILPFPLAIYITKHSAVNRILTLLFASAIGCGPAFCQEINRADRDLFEIHARPLLTAHCIRCHGEEKQEGGLRLTDIGELLKGGESGPAIVAGKPNDSLIIEALRHE